MFFAAKLTSRPITDAFHSTLQKPFAYGLIKEEQEGSEQDYPSHTPVSHGRRDSIILLLVLSLLFTSNLATWCVARRIYTREPISDQIQSDWQKGIDRNYYTRHDNGFEPYSAFTMSVDEYGDFPEQRWWDLGLYAPPVIVPEEYAADFNFDKSIHLFYPRGQSGRKGAPPDMKDGGFPATIEMNHQLHCVNFLRQGLYFNYQYYRDSHHMSWNTTNDKAIQIHLNHCVDSLRQHVLCTADARVHPYLISTNGKFADFGLPRKCRNWEAVRDFSWKNMWSHEAAREWLDDRQFTGDLLDGPRWPADRLWSGH